MDVNADIVIATTNQEVRRPRISVGEISTRVIGPMTLREPRPMPDTMREAYKPVKPGARAAVIWPTIQTRMYRR